MPDREEDRMLRFTWRDPLDEEELPAALEVLGVKLVEYAREAHAWGGNTRYGRHVHGELNSIAKDLASLGACLRDIAEGPIDAGHSREELALARTAPRWAARVDAVVGEIMTAIQEQDG